MFKFPKKKPQPLLSKADVKNPNTGILVFDPAGDFAEKVENAALHYDRRVVWFDPFNSNGIKFNPLIGYSEEEAVEIMAQTFRSLMADYEDFYRDLGEQLVRNSVKVLLRLDKSCGVEGQYAAMINFRRLIQNSNGAGVQMVRELVKAVASTPEEAKENEQIAAWFQNEYFSEKSKLYGDTTGVRAIVSNLMSDVRVKNVLCPNPNEGEASVFQVNQDLTNGDIILIVMEEGESCALEEFFRYYLRTCLKVAKFRRRNKTKIIFKNVAQPWDSFKN